MSKPSEKRDWAEVQMSPAARKCYEEFLKRYQSLQKEVETTPLVVLVWGPGPNGGALYRKRVEIRGVLRTNGYSAIFPEEIDKECHSYHASAKIREVLQAIEADFIVAIQGSAGSIAEVHDFAEFLEKLGRKMLIFIDAKHVEGYSYTGALHELDTLYHNVHQYQYPKDIDECHLRGAVEERLRVLRWAKWRATKLR